MNDLTRRNFLKNAAILGAGAAGSGLITAQAAAVSPVERRCTYGSLLGCFWIKWEGKLIRFDAQLEAFAREKEDICGIRVKDETDQVEARFSLSKLKEVLLSKSRVLPVEGFRRSTGEASVRHLEGSVSYPYFVLRDLRGNSSETYFGLSPLLAVAWGEI